METRKISELIIRPYGDRIDNQVVMCEPTQKEICDAIRTGELEERNYQNDFEELKSEWLEKSRKATDISKTWKMIVTKYHAGRIANFVENGWDHPIEINNKNEVTDGTHRIKAAIFKGLDEVEVLIK